MALTNAGTLPSVALAFGSSTHTLGAGNASFSVNTTDGGAAGGVALLKVGRKLVAANASFTVSGQAATLTENVGGTSLYAGPLPSIGMLLSAPDGFSAFGGFTLTGQNATLTKGRALICASATFTYSAAPALSDFQITSSSASFGVTGQTATLKKTYLPLTASVATFTRTGQQAGLAYVPVSGRVLPANTAFFTLSGQSANLNGQDRILACEHATFTISGQVISLPSRVWAQVTRDTGSWTIVIPSSSTWT